MPHAVGLSKKKRLMTVGGVPYALLMSLVAGLATGIGSFIAFFYKSTDRRFLSFALGLSAGVMIYISFMDLLFDARTEIAEITGNGRVAMLCTALAFFGGILLTALIDTVIPEGEIPNGGYDRRRARHERLRGRIESAGAHARLRRTGLVAALAIAIHNFPEGIATFVSALESPEAGVSIAVVVAIAIHNIPEGIAVSVPIYAATGSRRKAFWISFASGLAEPLGALLAWAVLMPFLSPMVMNLVFAAVAGIMVFISLDGLLPAAREYGENHTALYGLVAGMIIMAASIYMFA